MPNLLSALTPGVAPATDGSTPAANPLPGEELAVNSDTSPVGSGFSALLARTLDGFSGELAEWLELDGEALPDLPLAGNLLPPEAAADSGSGEAVTPFLALQSWLAALPVNPTVAEAGGEGRESAPVSIPLTFDGGKRQPALLVRYGAVSLSAGNPVADGQVAEAGPARLPLTGRSGELFSLARGVTQEQAALQALVGDRAAGSATAPSGVTAEGLLSLGQVTAAASAIPVATHPVTGTTGIAPALSIDVPPGQSGWNEAVGEKVAWMFQNNQPHAQVRLNPPHLGPMEIRVAVSHDQAHVTFTVHHQATADHLEAAIPRLREMLADSGLQLAQFDVRQQGQGSQEQTAEGGSTAFDADLDAPSGAEGDMEGSAMTLQRVSDGLLDTFA
ncbi:MAG: hypothetical protein Kow006_24000 [Gammaproteobacteria bacterium]